MNCLQPSLDKTISVRLRAVRRALGLTQENIAKSMKMHRPTIAQIEAGSRKVSASELLRFAELYEIQVTWFLNGAVRNETSSEFKMLIAASEISKLTLTELDRLLLAITACKKQPGQ